MNTNTDVNILKNNEDIQFDNFGSIIISMIIIVLSYAAAEYIYDLLENYKYARIIYGQISLPIYYAIIILGIMTSLDNVGFSKTALITLFGTIGLTLALSLQNLFSGIIAGIYVGFKNMYKIGDYLEVVDTGGRLRKGTIVNVDLFTTTIRSEDMMDNIIPNTIIGNNVVNIKRVK
jgi:small-conductance mechanosensitive channel